jgi:hypothetical protein
VTLSSSRKQFFGKLLGAAAVTCVPAGLVAKPVSSGVTRVDVSRVARLPVLRRDARAIARRDDI